METPQKKQCLYKLITITPHQRWLPHGRATEVAYPWLPPWRPCGTSCRRRSRRRGISQSGKDKSGAFVQIGTVF
jgi:hypothetical protein